MEILGTKSLPGSLDLISHLLDTLSRVVQTLPPAQADVSYIEQLLMSAIESAASKVKVSFRCHGYYNYFIDLEGGPEPVTNRNKIRHLGRSHQRFVGTLYFD